MDFSSLKHSRRRCKPMMLAEGVQNQSFTIKSLQTHDCIHTGLHLFCNETTCYFQPPWCKFGCRDAGTHVLMSCAAHTGFLCKDRSVIKTMSADPSINLYCVQGYCLLVLWFDPGSTNGKQSLHCTYPNCCTDTRYQPKIIHTGGIYVIEHFQFT